MPGKGQKTKERIVSSAMQLFSVKGFHGTSVNDVMETVRLTKGGLYGHYRSKEAIWEASYEQAAALWRSIVLREIRDIDDPLERIATVVRRDLLEYVGGGVFEGGCFFLTCLTDASGRSDAITDRVLDGFIGFSEMLASWVEEAQAKGMLRDGVNPGEVGDFLIVSLNGATALYSACREKVFLETSVTQIHAYLDSLKRTGWKPFGFLKAN